MAYQNKYRDYLEGKRPYQAYLDKPQESSSFLDKAIGYGAAATGLAVGGLLALKSGALRKPISSLIEQLGKYKEGYLPKSMKGIEEWAGQDRFKFSENFKKYGLENSLSMVFTGMSKLPKYIGEAQAKEADFIFSSLEKSMDEISRLKNSLTDKNHTADDIHGIMSEAREALFRDHGVTYKEQAERLKTMGYRQITAREVLETGRHDLFKNPKAVESFVQSFDTYKESMAKKGINLDYDIMIDKDIMTNAEIGKAKGAAHNVSDMRNAHNIMNRFIHSAATDFGFPFVNINPLRMAYVDNIFNIDKVPFAHFLSGDNYNPLLSNSIGKAMDRKVGEDFVFINGNVYKAKLNDGQLETIMKNTYLSASQEGPVARNMRIMSNITTSNYTGPKKYGSLGKMAYAFSDTLGIGFSDGPNTKFSAFDPMSYIPGFANYVDRFKPWDKIAERDLKYAFSEKPDYIVMNKMKHLGKDDPGVVFKQWFAGRNDPNNITTATLLPYTFFQRIDASLSQVKLGLPIYNQGSAADIFANLLVRRGLPIVAGIAAWNYLNFESEDNLGVNFEKGIAQTYKNASIGLAGVRDKLGVTKWAKHKTDLFQGGEQIAELPIVGRLFDLNDSQEETQTFWDTGMVPIRKGRWWPMGNTPYTGAKIDHWEPNWVRKIESDYKYTDVLWGSKDEYWENSIFPTPRHPLAPIEHLITDPYHYEEKHKLDRPYLMTGGIPEIDEIPIVGPLAGATIGQILKPQHKMHLEVWDKLHKGTYSDSKISPTPSDIIYQRKMVDMIPQGPGGVTGSGSSFSGQSGKQPYRGTFKGITATAPRTVRDNVGPNRDSFGEITIDDDQDLNSTYGESIEVSQQGSQVGARAWLGVKEMGGMYGFAANTASGEITPNPVIADTRAITSMRRQFWDLQIGGFGDDVNEIGRRFTGNREKWEDAFNPVRNQMPSWMPGSSYFTDFKHGDPYVKIPNGETRLPGSGYEALWGLGNPMDMKIGASSIGGTKEEIVNHLLHMDDFNNDDMEEILNYGTKIHAQAERELINSGVALATEEHLEDKEMRISGIYDAIVDNQKFLEYYSQHGILNLGNLAQNVADGRAVMDFKTMSDKKYNQNQMFEKNQEQINFYMHASGIHRAYLVHLNRDKPELPPKVYGFDFDQTMLDQTIAKVNDARDYVKGMIDKGIVGPADMYDWVDRYRILSDVAPYSDELKTIKKLTRMTDLKPDQVEQIKEINQQTTAKKKPKRLYPYRFSNSKIEKETVTVDRVIDNNTFFTKEYPDNPIRLAGVSVSNAKDNKVADAARDYLSKIIYSGAKVQIGYNADLMNKIKDNTYQTIQSVVYKGMTNVNKTLINQGLGKEKVEDFSPAAVHARFRSDEISVGKAWEFLAHLDSPANTKFLQVRSARESYERRDLYGKDWQTWQHPVDDYLVPWYDNLIRRNPIVATVSGALIGSLFGASVSRGKAPFGKLVGAMFGAATVGGGALYRSAHDAITGEKWIPERRHKEWNFNEYLDTLKYVKYESLYRQAADTALSKEGFNVDEYLSKQNTRLDFNKKLQRYLLQEKRKLYKANESEAKEILRAMNAEIKRQGNDVVISGNNKAEIMSSVNKVMADVQEKRKYIKTPPTTPIAREALKYHQLSKQTMYGYESGDPLTNLLAGLPKKDRDYLMPFVTAPESDRKELLRETPLYLRRVLESMWGEKTVEEKPQLEEYFKTHELPGSEWGGWRPDVNLDDVKVKIVKHEGMDESEFNIWADDKHRAALLNPKISTPSPNKHTTPGKIKRVLEELLGTTGLHDIQVQVDPASGYKVDVDIARDRRQELEEYVNQNASLIM